MVRIGHPSLIITSRRSLLVAVEVLANTEDVAELSIEACRCLVEITDRDQVSIIRCSRGPGSLCFESIAVQLEDTVLDRRRTALVVWHEGRSAGHTRYSSIHAFIEMEDESR